MTSIYDFKIVGIDGQLIDLAEYRGKKMILVNVASECGFTPQYQQLQELFEAFKENLIIIGFPCNDFGGQEPGSDSEIKHFCEVNYGVDFPMSSKIKIKNDPLFRWLINKKESEQQIQEIKWNFEKFLIDESGNFVAHHTSAVSPFDPPILEWINS